MCGAGFLDGGGVRRLVRTLPSVLGVVVYCLSLYGGPRFGSRLGLLMECRPFSAELLHKHIGEVPGVPGLAGPVLVSLCSVGDLEVRRWPSVPGLAYGLVRRGAGSIARARRGRARGLWSGDLVVQQSSIDG